MTQSSRSTRSTRTGKSQESDGGAASDDAEAAAIAGLRYEQALEELEALVQKVEDGELPLEDGIRAHRRAILLLRHCEGILDAAQARVEEIGGADLAEGDDRSE